jgi:uncharacterized metal-binding protein YceD (DUF177 family)
MPDHQSGTPAAPLWHVPIAVEDVSEQGERLDLVPDAEVRGAIARLAGLRDLPRLHANFEVRRHGQDGLHVTGRISATVGQACVVTLEPLVNEVEEDIDLLFVPAPMPVQDSAEGGDREASGNETELLIDGRIDLGAIATEFLVLGIDPYPRKPGAVFAPPPGVPADEGPFASLAALKKGLDDR